MAKKICKAGRYLMSVEPRFKKAIELIGPCRLETMPDEEPHQTLIWLISSQQVHKYAAEATLARLVQLYPGKAFPSVEDILAINVEKLRECGFSQTKCLYIKNVAESIIAGVIPGKKEALSLSDAELIKRLISVKGIGIWTAENFLMHNLEREDVLPVGDYGIREGWKQLCGDEEQPKQKALQLIGEAWSPHRSAASWYLWRVSELAKKKDYSFR